MIFWGSTSGSAGAVVPSTLSLGARGSFGGSTAGAGAADLSILAGGGGASSAARMREIGGRTPVFFFNSPSFSGFFAVFFSSIRETLSTSRCGDDGGAFATGGWAASVFFGGAGRCARAGLCSVVFLAGLTFEAAGL